MIAPSAFGWGLPGANPAPDAWRECRLEFRSFGPSNPKKLPPGKHAVRLRLGEIVTPTVPFEILPAKKERKAGE